MRLLTSLEDETIAKRFASYLVTKNIENTIDSAVDDKNKKVFNVWVYNEDVIEQAKNLLNEFLMDPKNQKYNIKIE